MGPFIHIFTNDYYFLTGRCSLEISYKGFECTYYVLITKVLKMFAESHYYYYINYCVFGLFFWKQNMYLL